jgi:transposase-like protein
VGIGKENVDEGAEGKSLVFGIYQRNGKVITFPVSDRKQDTLIPLIKLHTKKGSLYYTDDHTAYASLDRICSGRCMTTKTGVTN